MRHIGKERFFNYPHEFTTLPEYSAHRGQRVKVLRRTPEREADRGAGLEKCYDIQATDGWKGIAFESELSTHKKV